MNNETDKNPPTRSSLANRVLADWYAAMAVFFPAVEREMNAANMTLDETVMALERGYGDGVGEGFREYMFEED